VVTWKCGTNVTKCYKKVAPLFNRMVIFRTDNESFHGHPSALKTPLHVYRKSIALYYYTSDIEPGTDVLEKTTNFVDIPFIS
jgi:hypothetical protein